ncbi:MAG: F-box protein [Gammaproteobacteria bacterium]|nr:F-box protein [Gammaproteobacteria bacterium]
MKFNDVELPVPIVLQLLQYSSRKTIGNLSRVSKVWAHFFSDDSIWEQLLKKSGVSNTVALQQKTLVPTYKELYMMLTVRESFLKIIEEGKFVDNNNNALTTENLGLNQVTIPPYVFNILNSYLYLHDPNRSSDKEELSFIQDFHRMSVTIFESPAQYIESLYLNNSKLQPITDDSGSNALLQQYINNKSLRNNLLKINQNSLFVFGLFECLSMANGKFLGGVGPFNCKSSLIQNGNSLYFINQQQKSLANLDNITDELQSINFETYFMLEVTEEGIELLRYGISLSNELYPSCAHLFATPAHIESLYDQQMSAILSSKKFNRS